MSNTLQVPVPEIQSEYLGINNFLKPEKIPVIFTVGKILKSDGSILDITEINKSGYYIYKEESSGAVKIWDKKSEGWEIHGNVQKNNRELLPMEYIPENTNTPWKGTLFLIETEKKFQATDIILDYPRYFVKCIFEHQDSQENVHTGESDRSVEMRLPNLGANINVGMKIPSLTKEIIAGLEFQAKKDPDNVKYFIKNNTIDSASVKLKKDGAVTIKNDVGKAEIVIDRNGNTSLNTASGSVRVKLEPSGKITIENSNAHIIMNSTGNINISGNVTINGSVEIQGNLDVPKINGRAVRLYASHPFDI